jgi:hypothetical protein
MFSNGDATSDDWFGGQSVDIFSSDVLQASVTLEEAVAEMQNGQVLDAENDWQRCIGEKGEGKLATNVKMHERKVVKRSLKER